MSNPTPVTVNGATFTSGRQPQAHAALRTAFEMRVFDGFGPEDKELSAHKLSAITNTEELLIGNCQSASLNGSVACSNLLFLVRIMRALACLGIFDEVDESKWASNNISKKLASRAFRTFTMGL